VLDAMERASRAKARMPDAVNTRISADPATAYDPDPEVRRYRSIWISDVHLGTKGCKARILLDFLKHTESKYLYLVGDIIDGQALARSWYWAQSHNDVVQKLLRKARKGTKVVYVPGNHDEMARSYLGFNLGGIRIARDTVHATADGRKLWVTHGDAFDDVVNGARWLSELGDRAYDAALVLNVLCNRVRRRMGLPYWSLSSHLKGRVKKVIDFLCGYRIRLANAARKRGMHGVVCGHVHRPEMLELEGVLYCNDGDWVESCSALVEHADGRLEILDWIRERQMCLFEAHV
jgi:UDP-2,3-diacylglucosamine pyrophosphatase LpxH